jgi:hypothetical protein
VEIKLIFDFEREFFGEKLGATFQLLLGLSIHKTKLSNI